QSAFIFEHKREKLIPRFYKSDEIFIFLKEINKYLKQALKYNTNSKISAERVIELLFIYFCMPDLSHDNGNCKENLIFDMSID
ncbi:hypothetical protein BpHYR1_011140, partial [Brachionus plicatilis]